MHTANVNDLTKEQLGTIINTQNAVVNELQKENEQLRKGLEDIINHNTLPGGEKYNNHADGFNGLVSFARSVLDMVNTEKREQ